MPSEVLSVELKLYAELKLHLLEQYRGQFVVIHGDQYEVWHCYQDAIKWGYMTYGLKPFLCKQIVDPEPKVFL
jgi:hypothetical protein